MSTAACLLSLEQLQNFRKLAMLVLDIPQIFVSVECHKAFNCKKISVPLGTEIFQEHSFTDESSAENCLPNFVAADANDHAIAISHILLLLSVSVKYFWCH